MAYANFINLDIDPSKVDATLTNFPVRIYLTSATGPDSLDLTDVFTKLGDADRRRMSIMAGATECYVDIAYWNAAAGKAILDVRVPSVSDSERTSLTLYYDPAEPENTTYVGDTGSTPAQTVWDGSFKAVYHLCKDPSAGAPQIPDATGNGYNLTAAGSMTSGDLVDQAPFIKAIDFDGVNDALDYLGSNVLSNLPATFEVAGTTPSSLNTSNSPAMSLGRSSLNNQFYQLCVRYQKVELFRYAYQTPRNSAQEYVIPANDSLYAAAQCRANDDGSVIHNSTIVDYSNYSSWPNATSRLSVGASADYTREYFKGRVAEARLSSVARSDAWVKATNFGLLDTLILRGITETTEDLATRSPITDGTVLEDLADLTALAGWTDDGDLADLTTLAAWQYEDLATRSNMAHQATTDLATRLALTDGLLLTDLATRLILTDGTALASLATRGPLVKKAPVFQAVIAQRVRSVKDGL